MDKVIRFFSGVRIELVAVILLTIFVFTRYSDSLLDYHFMPNDYAVIYFSQTDSLIDFFKKGFSEYFIVFPEWTTPSSSFIRPIANIYVKLLTGAVDLKYANSFFIVIQCGILLLSLYFIKMHLNRKHGFLLLILLCPLFLNNPGYHLVAFHHEAICAVFGVSALIFYFRKLYIPASILLLFSVLTKETGFFLSVAVLAVELVQKNRNYKLIALFSFPVISWVIMRYSSDVSVTESYSLPFTGYINGALEHVLRGVVSNPLNFNLTGFYHLKGEMFENNETSNYYILLLSVAQIIVVLAFYTIFLREGYQRLIVNRDVESNASKVYLLLFFLVGIHVAMGLSARYAYFLVVPLFIFLLSDDYRFGVQRKRILVAASALWVLFVPYDYNSDQSFIRKVSKSFNDDVVKHARSDRSIAWVGYWTHANPKALGGLLKNDDSSVNFLFNYYRNIDCVGEAHKSDLRDIEYEIGESGQLNFSLPECIDFSFPMADKLHAIEDIELPFRFDETGMEFVFSNCSENKYSECTSLSISKSRFDEIHIVQPDGTVGLIEL